MFGKPPTNRQARQARGPHLGLGAPGVRPALLVLGNATLASTSPLGFNRSQHPSTKDLLLARWLGEASSWALSARAF